MRYEEESDNVLYDYCKEHYHEIENQELYKRKAVDDFTLNVTED